MIENLLRILLANAATATLLALAVAATSRFIRRPALVHALWALVLLKLIMPPVLSVGIIPKGTLATPPPPPPAALPAAPTGTLSTAMAYEAPAVTQAVHETTAARPGLLRPAVAFLWLAGTLAVAGLSLTRAVRFGRLVGEAEAADAGLQARALGLATRLGLQRCPRLKLLAARVSPMIWSLLSSPLLLLPRPLLARLDAAERDALMAHELAHVRRRDYWLRHLEAVAVALYWWLPVTWWARRRLREAEEQCCDALVVGTLPEKRHAYAEGLLKTLEFLKDTPTPALACGVGHRQKIEKRLIMILESKTPKRASLVQRALLVVLVLAVLAVFPTWAERTHNLMPPLLAYSGGSAEPSDTARDQEVEREFRLQMLELQKQTAMLEQQMRQLHLQRMELQKGWEQARLTQEAARMRQEAKRLESEGLSEEAERLRQEAEQMAGNLRRSLERLEVERHVLAETGAIEAERRAMMLEIETLESKGEREKARALRERLRDKVRDLERTHRHAMREQHRLERAEMDAREARAEDERRRLVREGKTAEAARLAADVAAVRAGHARAEAEIRREMETRAQLEDMELLEKKMETLEQSGRDQEALELAVRLDAMRASFDEAERRMVREHLAYEIEAMEAQTQRMRQELEDQESREEPGDRP